MQCFSFDRASTSSCSQVVFTMRGQAYSMCHAQPQCTRQPTGTLLQMPSSAVLGRRASLSSLPSRGHARGSAIQCRAMAATTEPFPTVAFKAAKMPGFPFVRVADQEDMKLALLLNVIDPGIGGVLIMGDRGTGKSVAVRNVFFPNSALLLLNWS